MSKKVKRKVIQQLQTKRPDKKFTWVIAYINYEYLSRVDKDIKKLQDRNVEACIPTVKVLKKFLKGKAQFDYIPLLFNYGFFRIKKDKLHDKDYTDALQKNIMCISGWVKDLAKGEMKKGARGNKKERTYEAPIATTSKKKIFKMIEAAEASSIHTTDDIQLLKVDQVVTLKGYPFEGMLAIIKNINRKTKKVKVKFNTEGLLDEVEVDFQNVYYSIYRNDGHEDKLSNNISFEDFKNAQHIDKVMRKYHE